MFVTGLFCQRLCAKKNINSSSNPCTSWILVEVCAFPFTDVTFPLTISSQFSFVGPPSGVFLTPCLFSPFSRDSLTSKKQRQQQVDFPSCFDEKSYGKFHLGFSWNSYCLFHSLLFNSICKCSAHRQHNLWPSPRGSHCFEHEQDSRPISWDTVCPSKSI